MRSSHMLGFVVLMLALVLVFGTFAAVAAPPGHARQAADDDGEGWIPPGLRDKGIPPGLGEDGIPPGLQEKGIPPGLLDKGGLPPGLHGRDELPPGIRLRFADSLEQADDEEEEYGLHILGPDAVAIPAETMVTVDYEAVFIDGDGEVSVSPQWSLTDEVDGVSLGKDGTLTVESDAEDGIVTLNAVYVTGEGDEETEYTDLLEVELYHQEPAAIEIVGERFIALDGDEEEDLDLFYEAVVTDQMGIILEDVPVTWEFSSGDFEDPLDGQQEATVLSLVLPVSEGEFTLTAKVDDLVDSLNVVIYTPKAVALEIVGESYVTLADEDEAPLTLLYTAQVLDQEGNVLEEADVEWSVESDVQTAVVDGVVEISDLPEDELTFTLRATSGDLEAEVTVMVYYPVAEDVVVFGSASVTLPEDEEPVTEGYTAVVLDQHDQELPGAGIVWLLTDQDGEEIEVPGVTLGEDGYLQVTAGADPGSLWIYCLHTEDVYTVIEVELVAA